MTLGREASPRGVFDEFDRLWEEQTKENIAQEVEEKTREAESEIQRLEGVLEDDPNNPGAGSIKNRIEELQEEISTQQERLTAPIKKPSEFMSDEQIEYHMKRLMGEGGTPSGPL